ncbi:MAG: 2'-5' RNA ligase family protein [Candidatus Riflebacteria bacterium]|nr:2'-5' RNA ligase family protein [Candidatus Riflebacteria bacterium]
MPRSSFQQLPYTVAFLLPHEMLHMVSVQRRRLSGCCLRYDPLETLHLTIKYLGYPSADFSEKVVVQLIPRIADTLSEFLPMRIAIRGIGMFQIDPDRDPVVYLKVLAHNSLLKMHEALTKSLGSDIACFPFADGNNFEPHITISKHVDKSEIGRLHRIIYRSRKTVKREFTLTNIVLFTPIATYPVLPRSFFTKAI